MDIQEHWRPVHRKQRKRKLLKQALPPSHSVSPDSPAQLACPTKFLSPFVLTIFLFYTQLCSLNPRFPLVPDTHPHLGLLLLAFPPLVKSTKGHILHHLAVEVSLHDTLHLLDEGGQHTAHSAS